MSLDGPNNNPERQLLRRGAHEGYSGHDALEKARMTLLSIGVPMSKILIKKFEDQSSGMPYDALFLNGKIRLTYNSHNPILNDSEPKTFLTALIEDILERHGYIY